MEFDKQQLRSNENRMTLPSLPDTLQQISSLQQGSFSFIKITVDIAIIINTKNYLETRISDHTCTAFDARSLDLNSSYRF